MYCKECGANIPEQRICPECGCLSGYRGTLPQPVIQKITVNAPTSAKILCVLGILLSVISFINVLGRAMGDYEIFSQYSQLYEERNRCVVLAVSGLVLYLACITSFLGIMVKKLRKLSVIFPILLVLSSIIYFIGGQTGFLSLSGESYHTVYHHARQAPKLVVILLLLTAVYLLFLLLKRPSVKLYIPAIVLSAVTAVAFVLTKGLSYNDISGGYLFSGGSIFIESTRQGIYSRSPVAVFTSAVMITVVYAVALMLLAKAEKRSS